LRARATQSNPIRSVGIRQAARRAMQNPTVPLFVLFLTLYIFSAGGHLYSIDEVIVYYTTKAIADSGSLNIAYALPFIHKLGFLTLLPDTSTVYYSPFGLLQPLLAVPLYYLVTPLGVEQWRTVDMLYSPILSAVSVCLVFAISRRLGRSTGISIAISVLYSVATIAWPYAKFFNEVTTASAMLLAATYFLFDQSTRRASVLLSGIFATLSVFARATQVIMMPVILLYVIFKAPRLRTSAINAALFLIPVAAGAMVYAYLNLARFGSPFDFAFGVEHTREALSYYSMNLIVGVYGMLLSSGEGLFVYYPLCGLGLFTLLWLRSQRNENWPRLIFAWFFFADLLFFARFPQWHGWGAWGARYLVVTVPYLMLALAPFLESAKTSIIKMAILAVTASVGIFSNLLGVIVNFNYTQEYYFRLGAFDPAKFPDPGIWIPRFSPLQGSWDLLWSQKYPAEFYSYAPDIFFLKARFDLFLYNTLGLPVLLATIALLVAEAYWLARTLKIPILLAKGSWVRYSTRS